MLTTFGKTYRHLRRKISRSHLLSRWLGYTVDQTESHEPGLVILQVDGLSRQQFEAALAKKRLPFLRKLIRRGYFQRLSFYSGIPSTTPAVQAEVMYGVKGAVPAFQFLHRKSGRVFRMFEHDSAKTIVDETLADARPLLTGGASFSNIYSGGAAEARCCAETTDLPSVLAELNPLRLLMMFVLYFFTLLRITALTFVEVVVAMADVVRSFFTPVRREWRNELKFVPARVLVSLVLREWVRIVVKLSVAQGTPVIYANLLGYDEQSHRRGPSGAFAHWGLKGIDKVIEDIFKSAKRSDARDYEVVVLSDHGQEETRIYEFETGQTIQNAVESALRDGPLGNRIVKSLDSTKRGRHLDQRMRRLMRIRHGRSDAPVISREELAEHVVVTAMGPIGHIYFPVAVPDDAKSACAEQLVNQGKVPLAVYRTEAGSVFARNARGLWQLPQDIEQVCGVRHRYKHEVQEDLVALTENPNAGDVIISGWDPEQMPLTFVQEHGAHGSIGTQETRGFALLPSKLSVHPRETPTGEHYIRGGDLHAAAGRFLKKWDNDSDVASGHETRETAKRAIVSTQTTSDGTHGDFRLRVMTYNTHHCLGMDGKCRPQRIADIIETATADVIALQEMDVNRARSGAQDQTERIASQLGMYHRFFPVWSSHEEQYGLSIISRFPLSVVREGILTGEDQSRKSEARGAIWVSFETDAGPVHLLNTHLGLRKQERREQIDELLSERWLDNLHTREPVIIAGDLNAGPKSPVMTQLLKSFHCTQLLADDHQPQKTFASVFPLRRIDHVLVSRHFRVNRVTVPKNHATAIASDHLPVCAELVLVADTLNPTKPVRMSQELPSGNVVEQVVNGGIP